MANIERSANDRLASGDQVTRAAIQAKLHEHRSGFRRRSSGVPQPLKHCWNVAETSYLNVSGTRILGLGDNTLLRLFPGQDVGGGCTAASSRCTTPGYYSHGHALAATHELSAGFDSPTSTPKSTPKSTCLASLSRCSATSTVGRPITAPARQHQPQQQEQPQQDQTDGKSTPVAVALAWDDGE